MGIARGTYKGLTGEWTSRASTRDSVTTLRHYTHPQRRQRAERPRRPVEHTDRIVAGRLGARSGGRIDSPGSAEPVARVRAVRSDLAPARAQRPRDDRPTRLPRLDASAISRPRPEGARAGRSLCSRARTRVRYSRDGEADGADRSTGVRRRSPLRRRATNRSLVRVGNHHTDSSSLHLLAPSIMKPRYNKATCRCSVSRVATKRRSTDAPNHVQQPPQTQSVGPPSIHPTPDGVSPAVRRGAVPHPFSRTRPLRPRVRLPRGDRRKIRCRDPRAGRDTGTHRRREPMSL